MTWDRVILGSHGPEANFFYTVRDTSGGEVRPVSQLTGVGLASDNYHINPNVTALAGDRVLFVWNTGYSDSVDIYYAVTDSAGNLISPATNLSNDGASQGDFSPDAAQLQDGRVVVAWTTGVSPNYRIRYAVLDEGYQRISGPTILSNPAAPGGEAYVSVAHSGQTAVLTWVDTSLGRSLYYALISRDGTQVTPPQIFYTSQATSPNVRVNYDGNGNTSLAVTTMQVAPMHIGYLAEASATSRTTSVLVRADGPDRFSWTANTEASWLTLSRTSGPNGEGFTVTTAPGLPLGAHNASIHIVGDKTYVENRDQTVTVNVLVVEKIHSSYLPLCSR